MKALSTDGTATAYLSLGSRFTLAAPPNPQPAVNQTVYGFSAAYDNGGNPNSPTFSVQLARNAGFSPVDQTVAAGGAQSLAFAGLTPNTQYFYRAAAYDGDGVLGTYGAAASTWTVPAPPVAAAGSAQSTTQATWAWKAGLNPVATNYSVELHGASDYSDAPLQTLVASSPNLSQQFSGLTANTSYYARVQALSSGGTQASAFVPLGELSTLAAPLGAAPVVFDVTYGSATLTWTPLPASPQAATCEGYRVDASTDSLFRGTLYTNLIPGSASGSGGVSGLPSNTQLYFRVGPANFDGASNPTAAASPATTLPKHEVTQTISAAGGSLTISPLTPPLSNIEVDVPPGAFPSGTPVTLNTSVELDLPAPVSNEARLTQIGAAAGFEVLANGLEPAAPVPVSFNFDPTLLPAGVSATSLQLARYDTSAQQWTLVPTQIDPSANRVFAKLSHFSLYAVFGVAAAGDLSDVSIFPIPWELNSTDPRFYAPVLTMTSLPPYARVRLLSISGELVWEGTAQQNGVLTWSGNNRFGRGAGSGTYLVVIEGANSRIVRRAVLVR